MSKEIIIGAEARKRIKAGIDKAALAVAPTLGVVGMAAIIDWKGLDPVLSDDGVTILKSLEFKDAYENMGLKMLRKGAVRTSAEGGDGTATTTVLTQAITQEAFREVETDSSKIQEVKERLQNGLTVVLDHLRALKRDVTQDDIERIATISSLDANVATLIADVIKQVGVNGVVTVEKSSQIGYTSEVVKGARFDSGLISPYFLNDREKEQTVLENPYIYLVDRRLSLNEQITPLMTAVGNANHKSVLIVSDGVDGVALASLIQNSKIVMSVMPDGTRMQGTFDIACVKNPYSSTRASDFLFDLAALTGATVISEEAGMKLTQVSLVESGRAEKVIVNRDTCTIIGGQTTEVLKERITIVEKKIIETTSEYEKAMLEERLAMLTGGIGVIRVGAYTDTEFNAKKLKFDNAVNATQAALQEGILPGGGTALLAVSAMDVDPIFKEALRLPFEQMGKNAGFENGGFNDVGSTPIKRFEGTLGVDFKQKKVVEMFDAGIIDPFKVTRLALESAVSIASSLITIESAIVDEEEPKQ